MTLTKMDQVRYVAALLVLLTVPLALIYWFIVHPLIRFWRWLGPARSYSILLPFMLGVLTVIYWLRSTLLGTDLGMNWLLAIPGLVVIVIGAIVGQQMRKKFSVSKLLGVHEIRDDGRANTLVISGIYARIRHPRYLNILLSLIGVAQVANHVGAYVAVAVFIPGLYAIIALEERELIERFGDQYREYCKTVPRLIPRL